MKKLIKMIETGAHPPRQLDKAIAKEIGFFDGTRSDYDLQLSLIPPFTTSIDAALQLVEGWAIVAKRHLLHRVMQRIDQGNLDPAYVMARLICIEALPQIADSRARAQARD